jgi:hypothetical protein
MGNNYQIGGQGGQNNVSTALVIVGALGLLAIGALVAILLIGPRETTTANNAAPSPQPTIDTASAASPSSATNVKEQSTPNLRETAPAPAPEVRPPAVVIPKPPPSVSSLPDQFQRRYAGRIGNGIPFSMTLERSGRALMGTASTGGSTDTLSGTIEPDGSFTLKGYENGIDQTGTYTGQILNSGQITGYWAGTKKRGSARFSVSEQ